MTVVAVKPKRHKRLRMKANVRARTPPEIAHAAAVLERRATRLLRLPGVLGLAAGFRRHKGRLKNEPVVTVFVKFGLKGRRLSNVPRHHQIPRSLRVRLGRRTLRIRIDLVPSRPGLPHRAARAGAPPGSAVGNRASPSNVGTVGWVARLSQSDHRPVLCGACHVLLRLRQSTFIGSGDKTFRFSAENLERVAVPPGTGEAVVRGYVIVGRRGGPLDAAVAILEDAAPTRNIPGLGPMGAVRRLDPDDLEFPSGPPVSMRVGRGLIQGKVTRYPARMTFLYDDAANGVVIEDLIETNLPTQPGDSGGLLVDADVRPIGMLLGAAGGRSYFVHLPNVVREFGLAELH